MNLISTVSFLLVILGTLKGHAQATCSLGPDSDPNGKAKASDGYNDAPACTNAIRGHVKMEFEASLQYMLMGIHFAQDTISLGGFAKMFFDSANEERQHGLKFIDYLKMRGDAELDLGINDMAPILAKETWADGTEALRDALNMEKAVSKSIRDIIKLCEENNDFYSADWMTGAIMEEQLNGQRHLAGLINTLSGFRVSHEHLADWMFSNQLLNGAY